MQSEENHQKFEIQKSQSKLRWRLWDDRRRKSRIWSSLRQIQKFLL